MSGPRAEDEDEDLLPAVDLDLEQSVEDFSFLDIDNDSGTHSDENIESDDDNKSGHSDSETKSAPEQSPEINLIPPDWHSNVVTFAHARIRDYLRTEFDPSSRRWDDCVVLLHDMNESKLRMVKACIDILRADIAFSNGVEDLLWYAQSNWTDHLLDLDCGEAGSVMSISVARMLATFFNDGLAFLESSYQMIDEFTATWFATNKYSQAVRNIISGNIEHLDECHREWAGRVRMSTRSLFENLTKQCSRRWLTKTGYDDDAYLDKSQHEFWLLFAFNSIDDDGYNKAGTSLAYYGSSITLAEIESAAALHIFPKNEHWYTGVAWIMMEVDREEHTRKAIEYFTKATELAAGAWVAFEGLAVCYGENLGLYEDGVRLMDEAIGFLPQTESFSGIDFYLRSKMGAWLRHLGDTGKALQASKTAYEGSLELFYPTGMASDHHILLSIRNYIEAMFDARKFEDILDFIDDLDARPTGEMGRSLWIVFLRAQFADRYDAMLFHKLRGIGRSLGRERTVAIINGSTERAVPLVPDAFSTPGSLWLAIQCIEWLYKTSSTPENAATLLEKVITIIDDSDEMTQQDCWLQRDSATAILGYHYLHTAICEKIIGKDPSSAILKLDNLAHHQQGGKRYIRASFPALAMGKWLHEYTHADEKTWMSYIKPSVKRALHLLSDNDPWNDQQAYAQLGQALLCANDVGNACIALGVTMKPFEELRDDFHEDTIGSDDSNKAQELQEATKEVREDANLRIEQPSAEADKHGETNDEADYHPDQDDPNADPKEPENSKYAGFELIWSCDNCSASRNKLQDPYRELHFCRMCDDVCFCESCIGPLRDGELGFATDSTCSNDHEHVMVFPVTQEAKALTDALLEKRFEVQEKWLEQLWKTWGDDVFYQHAKSS